MSRAALALPVVDAAPSAACDVYDEYSDTPTTGQEWDRFTSLPPLAERRWFHPASLPHEAPITVLDLDTTKNCNLRCTYCFKGETVFPGAKRMPLEVALAAIDWLIEASGDADQLWVNLMGGEPLLAWPTVRRVVPYAKLRAGRRGKAVQFGTTTNLTLVNSEIADFADRWGMGWHCSIDGPAAIQNRQRPGVAGRESSTRAERGVPEILKYRPTACARATVTPELVDTIFDSLLHFEQLGFVTFGFAVADEKNWRPEHFEAWDRQWAAIADYVIRRYREGKPLSVSAIDYFIEQHVKGAGRKNTFSCGAGRGMVMVDHAGDMWPCHRWDGADAESGSGGAWRFGNIFKPGFNDRLHVALLQRDRFASYKPECTDCPVEHICAGGCPAGNLSTTGSIYWQDEASCRTMQITHRHSVRVHDALKAEANAQFLNHFYKPDTKSADAAAKRTPHDSSSTDGTTQGASHERTHT